MGRHYKWIGTANIVVDVYLPLQFTLLSVQSNQRKILMYHGSFWKGNSSWSSWENHAPSKIQKNVWDSRLYSLVVSLSLVIVRQQMITNSATVLSASPSTLYSERSRTARNRPRSSSSFAPCPFPVIKLDQSERPVWISYGMIKNRHKLDRNGHRLFSKQLFLIFMSFVKSLTSFTEHLPYPTAKFTIEQDKT